MKVWFVLGFVVVSALAKHLPVSSDFGSGNVEFIGDLYKELAQTKPGNFLVCPLSLQIAFGLLNSGAKGTTAKQIATSLHLPQGEKNIRQTFLSLTENLRSKGNLYTLNTANKIYLAEGFPISDQYKSKAVGVFNSDIQNIDFGKTGEAISEINKWVENKTENKIKNLMSPDNVDASTIAVLLNAMYFQGKWVKPFFEETIELPFFLNANDSVLVDMMEVEDDFNYYESSELKARFLEMPYEGEDITMTFVLPNNFADLANLESRMDEVLAAPKYQYPTTVEVNIPKFKIETTIDFVPILQALGVTDAFSNRADFTGIGANQENIRITDVIQKAFIEVDEKGTSGGAATGISGTRTFKPEFYANRPFLFYLKHRVSGVLFIGRYSAPSKKVKTAFRFGTAGINKSIDSNQIVLHSGEIIDVPRIWQR